MRELFEEPIRWDRRSYSIMDGYRHHRDNVSFYIHLRREFDGYLFIHKKSGVIRGIPESMVTSNYNCYDKDEVINDTFTVSSKKKVATGLDDLVADIDYEIREVIQC